MTLTLTLQQSATAPVCSESRPAASVALGIDVGSTTVKVAVLDAATRDLLAQRYVRANGRPRQTLLATLREVLEEVPDADVRAVGFTGSGGGPLAEALNVGHTNELVAQTRAVSEFYPQARTVIEIGGQDSKLLILERDSGGSQGTQGPLLLVDFAMNTLCAAGTGSFLDQQAERLGISIENDFARLALQSTAPARIAGRCTVFAKSDMIHLQQKGVLLPDILAGLCYALVRNFRSVIGRGKTFTPPILFQGGVACNLAVVRAFEDVLGLEPGGLIIPPHHTLMAALGAGFTALDRPDSGGAAWRGLERLATAAAQESRTAGQPLPPLRAPTLSPAAPLEPAGAADEPQRLYLGIDVGSISTNVVALDEAQRVVARRYLRTAGRPLEAVRQGLLEVGAEVGAQATVCGVGVTGSGRYLTGDYVGADAVRNEITAQAAAAVHLDPQVETVFEIGGQDSKYIALNHGAVVDFTMNKACAAGTGSFLEEQAERLNLEIERDFSRLALAAPRPVCMGERCTVFMESDLIHHQQQGADVANLTAGLAYAVAHNYLNKVVNGRPIGRRVLFQGGVAGNASVAAAFGQVLARDVRVAPHHDVTGAIGAALLAQAEMVRRDHPASRFQGFDLRARDYHTQVFECRACPNLCEVSRVTIAGEPPLYYGARCERFEEAGRQAEQRDPLPDLFAEREHLLLAGYDAAAAQRAGVRLGYPRTLTFYDMFPFWRAFCSELGAGLILSDPTNPRIAADTAALASAETCFPVKVVAGHTLNLLEKAAQGQVDYLLMPGIISRENVAPGQTHNTYCPFIQNAPWIVAAQIDFAAHGVPVLRFPLHLLEERTLLRELRPLTQALGATERKTRRALEAGRVAQRAFYAGLRQRGAEIVAGLSQEHPAALLVGRPYSTNDPGLNQDLPYKLRKLGVPALPMDFLPLETVNLSERFDNMYWRSGQDILAAATLLRQQPHLHAIYVTNFACGPDSFILSFFRRALGEKPFLELEFDDHTADAGVITRCEAFFDSLGVRR